MAVGSWQWGLALGAEVPAIQGVGEGQVPGAAAELFGFALVSGFYFGIHQGHLGGEDGLLHVLAVGLLGFAPLYLRHVGLFGDDHFGLG